MVFSEAVFAKLKEVCGEIQKRYVHRVFGNRSRRRPRSFSRAECANDESKKDSANHQKPNGTGDIQKLPGSKKATVGRTVLADGYFISTVGAHGNEEMIKYYVQQQGKMEVDGQLRLF